MLSRTAGEIIGDLGANFAINPATSKAQAL
jgi:hypothetical protein